MASEEGNNLVINDIDDKPTAPTDPPEKPPTPPENDRDKFRCLYLLVDAAMEQLEEITAEKRRHSSSQQEVSSLQITIPTHNPPTQQPQQIATIHPQHQQVCV